jgi:GT2 family glycosyltransferase
VPDIGVSILNYQAAVETIRCVHSLLDAQAVAGGAYALHIHVADNASHHAGFEALQAGLDGLAVVALHRHERNLGFAAGHNRNIERLFSGETPDYVWLLNNDCLVDASTVPALLKCAGRRPEVGIWGATLLEADGRTIQCAGGCFYQTWLSSHQQHGQGTALSELNTLGTPRFDYISGASLFMPAATLAKGLHPPKCRDRLVGPTWLNEEFFLYFEELDLAQRLKPEFEMAWCRDALVSHAGGSGTGSGQGLRSADAEYHSTLSALKFTKLYHPGLLWLMMPARLVAKGVINLGTGRLDLCRALLRAYGGFLVWLRNSG